MPKLPKVKVKHSGLIVLPAHRVSGKSGTLVVGESTAPNGFALRIHGTKRQLHVRRWFAITDIERSDSRRADHAHRKTSEVIFCISGACTVLLDDGTHRQRVRLDDPSIGLITGPNLWHSISDFVPGSALIAFADGPYDPDEYVNDYDEFMSSVNRKRR